jgi:hypothetical protein
MSLIARLLINAAALWVAIRRTAALSGVLGLGFHVSGFGADPAAHRDGGRALFARSRQSPDEPVISPGGAGSIRDSRRASRSCV